MLNQSINRVYSSERHAIMYHIRLLNLPYYFRTSSTAEAPVVYEQRKYAAVREEFQNFIHRPAIIEIIKANHAAVYSMLVAHGDTDTLVDVALLLKGTRGRVVNAWDLAG